MRVTRGTYTGDNTEWRKIALKDSALTPKLVVIKRRKFGMGGKSMNEWVRGRVRDRVRDRVIDRAIDCVLARVHLRVRDRVIDSVHERVRAVLP
jgi:hypothetical protein